MARHRNNKPRFSPGPKPGTDRGGRRHKRRNPAEQKHAKNVWIPREDWVASLAAQRTPELETQA